MDWSWTASRKDTVAGSCVHDVTPRVLQNADNSCYKLVELLPRNYCRTNKQKERQYAVRQS